MRPLSPSLILAAAALSSALLASDASAAPRFGHGFRGGGKAFAGHRHGFRHHPGFRHAAFNRVRHHGRFAHHRFGHGLHRGAFLGSAWVYGDGYGYPYGAPVNVSVEQTVATGGYGPPSFLDLPASTGIRQESAAQPVIYVIRSGPRSLMRKGHRGGAKVASLPGGRAAAQPAETGGLSPRIVQVSAPRGF